jgi:hypothetical protein
MSKPAVTNGLQATVVLDDCRSLDRSKTIWNPIGQTRIEAAPPGGIRLVIPAEGGGIELAGVSKSSPADWSRYRSLSFDVSNAQDRVLCLVMRIDDDEAGGFKDRFEPCDAQFLPAGTNTHIEIDLTILAANNGRRMDTSKIMNFTLHLSKVKDGSPERILVVDAFRFVPLAEKDYPVKVEPAREPKLLVDPNDPNAAAAWSASKGAVAFSNAPDGGVWIQARPGSNGAIRLSAQTKPMDWRAYRSLRCKIRNEGHKDATVNVRITEPLSTDGHTRFEVEDVKLPPDATTDLKIDITRMAMRCGRAMDMSRITGLSFDFALPSDDTPVSINDLRLDPAKAGVRNELRPGRIPGQTPATLGKALLDDPEIKPLIPIFQKLPPMKFAFLSHSVSISEHWSTSGGFLDIAAEAVKAVNPEVEYKGFHRGGMAAGTAVADFLGPMQEYKPTDTYVAVLPNPVEAEIQIIDTMKAAGSRVYVFDGIKPWGQWAPDTQDQVRKLCKERDVPFIEMAPRCYGQPGSYRWCTVDTIHMVTEGHIFLAKELLKEWAKIYAPLVGAGPPVAGQGGMTPAGVLWDERAALLHRNDMPVLREAVRVCIHKAVQGEYQFLSGPCIVVHKGRLFACWTNSRRDEDPSEELVRGRWSDDGGRTWSNPEVVAGDATPTNSYGHGTILSHAGQLWCFPVRFIPARGGEPMRIDTEAFRYDEDARTWQPRGVVASNFWALDEPKALPGGGWVLGGDDDPYPGCGPSVAIIDKDDVTSWKVVKIPFGYALAPTNKPLYAIETTVWAGTTGPDSSEIVAVMRNPFKDIALMSISTDRGRSWSPVKESNLPMAESRAFAGTLSTGQRYLVFNSGNREHLVLAVSSPGRPELSRIWMLRQGNCTPRWPTHSKRPQLSYPWACEANGNLYVTYAVGKEDCEISIVPLAALVVK